MFPDPKFGLLSAAAISRVPSSDDASETQTLLGAVVTYQVAPELVDAQMPPNPIAPHNLDPSAEQATAYQLPAGLDGTHVSPPFVEV
jgi:hypothetical protein